jgi:hypothetical protein
VCALECVPAARYLIKHAHAPLCMRAPGKDSASHLPSRDQRLAVADPAADPKYVRCNPAAGYLLDKRAAPKEQAAPVPVSEQPQERGRDKAPPPACVTRTQPGPALSREGFGSGGGRGRQARATRGAGGARARAAAAALARRGTTVIALTEAGIPVIRRRGGEAMLAVAQQLLLSRAASPTAQTPPRHPAQRPRRCSRRSRFCAPWSRPPIPCGSSRGIRYCTLWTRCCTCSTRRTRWVWRTRWRLV